MKNELIVYDLESKSFENSEIPVQGHYSCVMIKDSILFWSFAINECLIYNIKAKQWQKLKIGGFFPSERKYHSTIFWRGEIIIYGGRSKITPLNDCHSLSLKESKWKSMYDVLTRAPIRSHHSAITYKNKMYIFGGCDDKFYESNKLYVLDLENRIPTGTWKEVECKGDIPPPIAEHAATIIGDDMYIFGGIFTTQKKLINVGRIPKDLTNEYYLTNLNTLFKFNFPNLEWTKIQVQGESPSPRCGSSLLAKQNRLYLLFGHQDMLSFDKVNDIWSITIGPLTLEQSVTEAHFKLSKFLNNAEFSDYKLKIGDKIVHIHKCIVSQNRKLIFPQKPIQLDAEFGEILEYFYTGKIKNIESRRSLLKMAEKFGIEKLVKSINDEIFTSSLIEHLRHLRKTGDFSDLEIISRDGQVFKCHKVILAAFDEYFAEKIRKLESPKMEVKEFHGKSLALALDYIYQQDITFPDDLDVLFEMYCHFKRINNHLYAKKVHEEIFDMTNFGNAFLVLLLCDEWDVKGEIQERAYGFIDKMKVGDVTHILLDKVKRQEDRLKNQDEFLKNEKEKMDEWASMQLKRINEYEELVKSFDDRISNLKMEHENLKKKFEEKLELQEKEMSKKNEIILKLEKELRVQNEQKRKLEDRIKFLENNQLKFLHERLMKIENFLKNQKQ